MDIMDIKDCFIVEIAMRLYVCRDCGYVYSLPFVVKKNECPSCLLKKEIFNRDREIDFRNKKIYSLEGVVARYKKRHGPHPLAIKQTQPTTNKGVAL